jgi:hypothetical protein
VDSVPYKLVIAVAGLNGYNLVMRLRLPLLYGSPVQTPPEAGEDSQRGTGSPLKERDERSESISEEMRRS